VIGLSFIPVLPVLFEQSSSQHAGGWWWVEPPGVREILNVIRAFCGASFKMASAVFQQPSGIQVAGVGTTSILIISAVVMAIRKKTDLKFQALFTNLCFSLALPFAMSFYRHEAFVWYRHTVILFPIFCVVLGGVASQQKNKTALQLLIG